MGENLDLYFKIQSLLLTKDTECKGLRYLSSRISKTNVEVITDICQRVIDLVESFKIPHGEDEDLDTSESSVNLYKFLLLNTDFQCQDQLSEDISYTHLADICPAMSTNLLLEILHSLNFDSIVSESTTFFPLDLTVEIIGMVKEHVDIFDPKRQEDLIVNLIFNLSRKIVYMKGKNTQSLNLEENIEKFTILFQELIKILIGKESSNKNVKKSEELGLKLMRMLDLAERCFSLDDGSLEISEAKDKLYKLTFGRDHIVSFDSKAQETCVSSLTNSLLFGTMELLKQIDVNTFLHWAELETDGDPSVSLQQSIGYSCYRFLSLLDNEKFKELNCYDGIYQCLQHFSRKPVEISDLKLEELLARVEKGEKKALKELMSRYESWDHLAFDHVERNHLLLDKDDFFNLLRYLTILIVKPGQEQHKEKVYRLVTKLLLQMNLQDDYQVILKCILNLNAQNVLEGAETEATFRSFLLHNSDLKVQNTLKVVLFFLLKNPEKYLKLLVKISLGCVADDSELKNVMIPPKDLTVLSAIMNIKMENNCKLILNILRSVGMEVHELKVNNFSNFIMMMINTGVITSNEVIRDVFVNLIEADDLPASNIKTVLNCLRQTISPILCKSIYDDLLVGLAKRMLMLRISSSISKQSICENLFLITTILEIVINNCIKISKREERQLIVQRVWRIVHPIDEYYFRQLLDESEGKKVISIGELIKSYSKRIENVLLRLKKIEDGSNFVEENLSQEILRNVIISSTQNEFEKTGLAMSLLSWKDLNLKKSVESNDEALDNFLSINSEILCYFFTFSDKLPTNSFAYLLKFLAEFLKSICGIETFWNSDKQIDLIKNLFRKMGEFIRGTDFEKIYAQMLIQMNNYPTCEPAIHILTDYIDYLETFADESLKITSKHCLLNDESLKIHLSQKLINHCLHFNRNEDYICDLFHQLFH